MSGNHKSQNKDQATPPNPTPARPKGSTPFGKMDASGKVWPVDPNNGPGKESKSSSSSSTISSNCRQQTAMGIQADVSKQGSKTSGGTSEVNTIQKTSNGQREPEQRPHFEDATTTSASAGATNRSQIDSNQSSRPNQSEPHATPSIKSSAPYNNSCYKPRRGRGGRGNRGGGGRGYMKGFPAGRGDGRNQMCHPANGRHWPIPSFPQQQLAQQMIGNWPNQAMQQIQRGQFHNPAQFLVPPPLVNGDSFGNRGQGTQFWDHAPALDLSMPPFPALPFHNGRAYRESKGHFRSSSSSSRDSGKCHGHKDSRRKTVGDRSRRDQYQRQHDRKQWSRNSSRCSNISRASSEDNRAFESNKHNNFTSDKTQDRYAANYKYVNQDMYDHARSRQSKHGFRESNDHTSGSESQKVYGRNETLTGPSRSAVGVNGPDMVSDRWDESRFYNPGVPPFGWQNNLTEQRELGNTSMSINNAPINRTSIQRNERRFSMPAMNMEPLYHKPVETDVPSSAHRNDMYNLCDRLESTDFGLQKTYSASNPNLITPAKSHISKDLGHHRTVKRKESNRESSPTRNASNKSSMHREIEAEMKRAKDMALPVNHSDKPVSKSSLDPSANAFKPSELLHTNGKKVLMRWKGGAAHFDTVVDDEIELGHMGEFNYFNNGPIIVDINNNGSDGSDAEDKISSTQPHYYSHQLHTSFDQNVGSVVPSYTNDPVQSQPVTPAPQAIMYTAGNTSQTVHSDYENTSYLSMVANPGSQLEPQIFHESMQPVPTPNSAYTQSGTAHGLQTSTPVAHAILPGFAAHPSVQMIPVASPVNMPMFVPNGQIMPFPHGAIHSPFPIINHSISQPNHSPFVNQTENHFIFPNAPTEIAPSPSGMSAHVYHVTSVPPVLNLQALSTGEAKYCPLEPDFNNNLGVTDSKNQTGSSNVNTKRDSLVDRVGYVIKYVNQCLRVSKSKKKDEKEEWRRALKRMLNLPAEFYETKPSDSAEQRQLQKLANVVNSFAQEIKASSQTPMSETDLVTELMHMTYPLATDPNSDDFQSSSSLNDSAVKEIGPIASLSIQDNQIGPNHNAKLALAKGRVVKVLQEFEQIPRSSLLPLIDEGISSSSDRSVSPQNKSDWNEQNLNGKQLLGQAPNECPNTLPNNISPYAHEVVHQEDHQQSAAFGQNANEVECATPVVDQTNNFVLENRCVQPDALSRVVEENDTNNDHRSSFVRVNVGSKILYFENTTKQKSSPDGSKG